MTGELILIVDDDEKNRKLARDVLTFAGFRTMEAGNGDRAIALAEEHAPAVILMDIRLPDMDGATALELLRGKERTTAIPVVALTAYAMKGDRERFLAQGFDGYLEKPISVKAFPDQVRGFCGSASDGR
jgi:two-component system cell cycle response regulator DivK